MQVIDNKIIGQFPVKPDHTHTFSPMHHVQLYLNKQLIFHSNWLPISTLQDHAKFKVMFQQICHEYTMFTHYNYYPTSSFVPLLHSELVTVFNKPSYYLACFENNNITSIELETKTANIPSQPETVPIHVQFYIGKHLVLCSETQLKNLDVHTLHFIVSFILTKLTN